MKTLHSPRLFCQPLVYFLHYLQPWFNSQKNLLSICKVSSFRHNKVKSNCHRTTNSVTRCHWLPLSQVESTGEDCEMITVSEFKWAREREEQPEIFHLYLFSSPVKTRLKLLSRAIARPSVIMYSTFLGSYCMTAWIRVRNTLLFVRFVFKSRKRLASAEHDSSHQLDDVSRPVTSADKQQQAITMANTGVLPFVRGVDFSRNDFGVSPKFRRPRSPALVSFLIRTKNKNNKKR